MSLFGQSSVATSPPSRAPRASGSTRAAGACPSTMLLIFLRRAPTPELMIAIAEWLCVSFHGVLLNVLCCGTATTRLRERERPSISGSTWRENTSASARHVFFNAHFFALVMSQAPTEKPARRGCSSGSEAESSQRAPLRHNVPGELWRETAWQRVER